MPVHIGWPRLRFMRLKSTRISFAMKGSSGYCLPFILLFFTCGLNAQNHYDRFESIDVVQYIFEIRVNDSSNWIEGTAHIVFKEKKASETLRLDLTSVNSDGLGMEVAAVTNSKNEALSFIHENDELLIQLEADSTDKSATHENSIKYSGIPADGLIISKNKYGDRTFFGDNWPNRARNWLPTIDHPSDKAPVVFSVTAPSHYQLIGNGILDTIISVNKNYNTTIWREEIPISTKLMVIGAADFMVGNDTVCNGIPVNAWVFRQNQEKGFENYRYGTKALQFYAELIGPYPYEKLAHVQSKTRYGGMENASCIFYSENSAVSDQSQERLFAHEVAHQWFGNSVTEENWHHVWLSEGFATYLTHVYKQHFYGERVFREGLINDRERVIRFFQSYPAPVIDTLQGNYSQLLNTNSYQKASWFLHMLHHKLGDEIFFSGLRKYYTEYRNSTALTSDFRMVMEKVLGENLEVFFDQWLRQPGHPVLKWHWKQNQNSELSVTVEQTQKDAFFTFPLEIAVFYNDGSQETVQIEINEITTSTNFPAVKKVTRIELDPEINLLFEEVK